MPDFLQTLLTSQVGLFLLTFVRMGTALMIMPGLGDTFMPDRVRLILALGISLIFMPYLGATMPGPVPLDARLIPLVGMEFIIGIFLGTVLRLFLSALDVAGVIISVQSGLANAQLFNPAFATQGSIVGAFLTILAVTLIFISGAHHMMIAGLMNSYKMFPVGELPLTGDMSMMIMRTVSAAFLIGVQVSAPILIVIMVLYVGMGILARLMPHMQIFTFSIPLQIILTLIVLTMTIQATMMFWLAEFKDVLTEFMFVPRL